MDNRIKTPKVERVLLHQHHRSREYITGTLCLTDRHLIFIEPTGMKETWVLYHHILSCDRQALTTKGYPLVIDTKTFQQLCLIIPRESDIVNIIETINLFSQPEKYEALYAFQYIPNLSSFPRTLGWNLYDPIIEYGRMGIDENWKVTHLNATYELCETYSNILYVPAKVDDSVIMGSAKFRGKGRLPVLSYYYKPKNSSLCRCSQPLTYITRRSVEDEAMIQAIIDTNSNSSFMYLIDTRPKLNAVVNKAAHKGGYESTEHYTNIRYQFFNIHNIHVMRESLQKLTEAVHSSYGSVNCVLSTLESSSWLKHIHLIMEASLFIAKALYHEGVNVLVHCSDGWDRTAQTCALSSILIDPYYRTIHGFMILIEREWLSFGHKFTIRSGHLHGDIKETSPIFTQFLEATWQVMVQFPTCFQYNELFLITIHDHLFSSQFGTFLGNNERERQKMRFNEKTYSLWGYIWGHLEDFINPLYDERNHSNFLNPSTNIPDLSLWRGLYCRHESGPHPHELWQEVAGSILQQNSCFEDHLKYLIQHTKELADRLERYKNSPSPTQVTSHDTQSHDIPLEDIPSQDTSSQDEDETIEVREEEVEAIDNKRRDSDIPIHKPHITRLSTGSFHSNQITTLIEDTQVQLPKKNLQSHHGMKSVILQSLLLHIPEMNLPWPPLRSVSKCACGLAFSFTQRKYHCSFCGTVTCGLCGANHAQLPYMVIPSTHRVCKTCFKLMSTRQEVIT